jgi:4-amino-4-deoxychorismate lyase
MFECLVDGEILEHVQVNDRGLNYGDGLFETLAVSQGHPRWWQDHMDRLSAGCDRLNMQMPPQAVLLREVQTVSAGRRQCIVKIVLTRGSAGRGYHPADPPGQTRLVSSHSWPLGIEEAGVLGVEARLCSLRLAVQPALGGIKHLNRLEQVLASSELPINDETGAPSAEGILLDMDEHVTCAVSANIFLVYRDQLMTPRLDRCGVRGVLRGRILKAFKKRCELRRITRDMLDEASEVFLCSSVRGIIPVRSIDGVSIPIGPVTREFQQWLLDTSVTPGEKK